MRSSAVALLIVLAACGHTAAPDATSVLLMPTSPPTPRPTVDREALGAAYLATAERSNTVACRFIGALRESPTDLELIQRRALRFAHAQQVVANALTELSFPPDLQEHFERHIQNRVTLESELLAVAAAADLGAVNASINARVVATIQEGSATDNLIRKELGLPSVPAGVCNR